MAKKHIVTSVLRTASELPEVHVDMGSGHRWTFRRGLTNKIHLMSGPGRVGKPSWEHPGEYKVAREAAMAKLPLIEFPR